MAASLPLPPMTYVSPFISNIDKPLSAFGNDGPKKQKAKKKPNEKAMLYVRQL